MAELKPCPYCGGEAFIREQFGNFYITANHKKNCLVSPNTWLMSNKNIKKQIKSWNMRCDNGLY